MLTQEQLDKINERVWIYEETRYPDANISLVDLAEILGLEVKCDDYGLYKDVPDNLSFPAF